MPRSIIAGIMADNIFQCKYKGKGCGKEDNCTHSQNSAKDTCNLYPYMVFLENFSKENMK